MVLGIISIALFWTLGFGVLLGITGIVFGAIGMNRARQLPGQLNRGRGLAGVITGTIGIVLGIGFVVIAVAASDDLDINTDPADGICDESRFMQDPDC